MTRTLTISKNPLLLLVTGLVALALVALAAADRADAALMSGNVTATCYSDGYIVVNDGGNVASAPKHLRLQIAHRTATGWSWKKYAWRSISGSSFRLNATKGAQFYIHATIATANGSGGFTYASNFVSVTNVTISPIGAITSRSSNSRGFCQT